MRPDRDVGQAMVRWAAPAVLICSIVLGPGGARTAEPEHVPNRADVIVSVLPAVVSVQTVPPPPPPTRSAQDQDMSSAEPRPLVHGYGSGFVIDAKGIIVTNRHVIANALSVGVIFADNESLPARRIGELSRADVALLRVDPRSPLRPVALGDSS